MQVQQDTSGKDSTRSASEAPYLGAGRALTYQPALDGLRAVAVVAVLLFHGGFGWMSGGYLGVSVFCTLSGFLIAYADLFRTGTSPIAHYWSLAIEEQFYLVWPLTFAVLVRWRRTSTRLRRIVITITILSATLPIITRVFWSSDAVYFATQARAAELLIGASLALILRTTSLSRIATVLRWLAIVAIAIIAVEFVVTPAGDGWVYEGFVPLFAVVSAALIAGLQVDGPVQRVLAMRPLVALGRISYGVYLFHWPVFVVLDDGEGDECDPVLFWLCYHACARGGLGDADRAEDPSGQLARSMRPVVGGADHR